jgi:hypothetical protein
MFLWFKTALFVLLLSVGSAFIGCGVDDSSSEQGKTDTDTDTVTYADCDCTEENDCPANALPVIQDGADEAENTDNPQVFAAEGNYLPSAGGQPVLTMKTAVGFYGGFAGTENLLEERPQLDAAVFSTLDGDTDGIFNGSVVMIGAPDKHLTDKSTILPRFAAVDSMLTFIPQIVGRGLLIAGYSKRAAYNRMKKSQAPLSDISIAPVGPGRTAGFSLSARF